MVKPWNRHSLGGGPVPAQGDDGAECEVRRGLLTVTCEKRPGPRRTGSPGSFLCGDQKGIKARLQPQAAGVTSTVSQGEQLCSALFNGRAAHGSSVLQVPGFLFIQ